MTKEFNSPRLKGIVTITFISDDFFFIWNDNIIYDFDKREWPEMKRQLLVKSWFTKEMLDYITSILEP